MEEKQDILQKFRESLSKTANIKIRFKIDRFIDNIPEMLEGYYKNEVETRGGIYVSDNETQRHLKKAATWLVSTNKVGLMLFGTVGNGKTTLVRAIGKLIDLLYQSDYYKERKALLRVSALELAAIAKDNPEKFRELKQTELLAIDDVGVEPALVKSWGNEISPFVELLYSRYDNQRFTLITSNLTVKEIANRYGPRIADRFAEMFDYMAFNNNSYR